MNEYERKKYRKEYYDRNKEKELFLASEYRKNHKKEIAEKATDYRKRNKKKFTEYSLKSYRKLDQESKKNILEKNKERQRQRTKEGYTKITIYHSEWKNLKLSGITNNEFIDLLLEIYINIAKEVISFKDKETLKAFLITEKISFISKKWNELKPSKITNHQFIDTLLSLYKFIKE